MLNWIQLNLHLVANSELVQCNTVVAVQPTEAVVIVVVVLLANSELAHSDISKFSQTLFQ